MSSCSPVAVIDKPPAVGCTGSKRGAALLRGRLSIVATILRMTCIGCTHSGRLLPLNRLASASRMAASLASSGTCGGAPGSACAPSIGWLNLGAEGGGGGGSGARRKGGGATAGVVLVCHHHAP